MYIYRYTHLCDTFVVHAYLSVIAVKLLLVPAILVATQDAIEKEKKRKEEAFNTYFQEILI